MFCGTATTPATAAVASPAKAVPADTGPSSVVGHPVPAAEAETATGYWTPQRMKRAVDADLVRPGPRTEPTAASGAESKPAGGPVSFPGTLGQAGASQPAPKSDPVPAYLAASVPRPYTNNPDKQNGKVFFSKYTSWGTYVGDFSCSGTSVNSAGKSLVWTAGHCVEGGAFYGAHRNWVFIPAYSSSYNGHRPYKTWAARELWTLKGWADFSDFSYDVGAAIVWRVDNVRLTTKIGGQGIVFNASRSQSFNAFGYPAESPFNGFSQWRCNSPVLWEDDPGSGPDTMGILCDMTGGSSGGGWLINLTSAGWGYVNSVNSYSYGDGTIDRYGPYQGSGALGLYNFVKNKSG